MKRLRWEATRDVSFIWVSRDLIKTKQFRIFENMKSQIQHLRLAPKGSTTFGVPQTGNVGVDVYVVYSVNTGAGFFQWNIF